MLMKPQRFRQNNTHEVKLHVSVEKKSIAQVMPAEEISKNINPLSHVENKFGVWTT
jgi:hypothetical protein